MKKQPLSLFGETSEWPSKLTLPTVSFQAEALPKMRLVLSLFLVAALPSAIQAVPPDKCPGLEDDFFIKHDCCNPENHPCGPCDSIMKNFERSNCGELTCVPPCPCWDIGVLKTLFDGISNLSGGECEFGPPADSFDASITSLSPYTIAQSGVCTNGQDFCQVATL